MPCVRKVVTCNPQGSPPDIAGNAEEAQQLIANRDQIDSHHSCEVHIDIADVKYDSKDNYDYIRSTGSVPIIDYNPRNENLSPQALLGRGCDQNGWPFAPCGLLCRPNGYDPKHQRLSFCCFKRCLKLNHKAIENLNDRYDIAACTHLENLTGFATHMSVKEHPRLVNEIPRGSKRHQNIKKFRSASERANSSIKEDIKILDKPRVLNRQQANILAQIAAIVLLLTRALRFVVRTTLLFRKVDETDGPAARKKLKSPTIPKSILNLIQLE